MISNDNFCRAYLLYRFNVIIRVDKPVGFMSAHSGPMPPFPFRASPGEAVPLRRPSGVSQGNCSLKTFGGSRPLRGSTQNSNLPFTLYVSLAHSTGYRSWVP